MHLTFSSSLEATEKASDCQTSIMPASNWFSSLVSEYRVNVVPSRCNSKHVTWHFLQFRYNFTFFGPLSRLHHRFATDPNVLRHISFVHRSMRIEKMMWSNIKNQISLTSRSNIWLFSSPKIVHPAGSPARRHFHNLCPLFTLQS